MRLHFWDLGGQEELKSLWKSYYKDAHGIIFVVDSTDQNRIDNVVETMSDDSFILENVVDSEELEGIPMVMLANKQDVEAAMKVEDIKQIFNQIASALGARDSKVIPCSALTG